MDSRNLLTLLGLCRRGGNLAVGEEPVEGEARARRAKVLLLASDAADHTRRRSEHFAKMGNCPLLTIPCTKEELGSAVGRTSVAIVAVTDIGLASAAAERLSAMDSARYGEAAALLSAKAERTARRREETLRHEKNRRQGKLRAPRPAEPTESTGDSKERPSSGHSEERTQRRRRRPPRESHPGTRVKSNPYAASRPVKRGKGSDRKGGTGGAKS